MISWSSSSRKFSLMVEERDALRRKADDLVVELVEKVFADGRGEGRADAPRLHALLHDENPSGLADALVDRLEVEGLERDEVDDLGVVPLRRQLPHRLHHDVPHAAV